MRAWVSLVHLLNPQHSQPSPAIFQQSIHGPSTRMYIPPHHIAYGRTRDERVAMGTGWWGCRSSPQGIGGDPRMEVCIRGFGRPACRCRRAGDLCPRAGNRSWGSGSGQGSKSRRRETSLSFCSPRCGAGRKSQFLPTTGVDCRPAPPPTSRWAVRQANVRLATGCEVTA